MVCRIAVRSSRRRPRASCSTKPAIARTLVAQPEFFPNSHQTGTGKPMIGGRGRHGRIRLALHPEWSPIRQNLALTATSNPSRGASRPWALASCRSGVNLERSGALGRRGAIARRHSAAAQRGSPARYPGAAAQRGGPARRPDAAAQRGGPTRRHSAAAQRGGPTRRHSAAAQRGSPARRARAATAPPIPFRDTARGPRRARPRRKRRARRERR
jgi:hypothetical protein